MNPNVELVLTMESRDSAGDRLLQLKAQNRSTQISEFSVTIKKRYEAPSTPPRRYGIRLRPSEVRLLPIRIGINDEVFTSFSSDPLRIKERATDRSLGPATLGFLGPREFRRGVSLTPIFDKTRKSLQFLNLVMILFFGLAAVEIPLYYLVSASVSGPGTLVAFLAWLVISFLVLRARPSLF